MECVNANGQPINPWHTPSALAPRPPKAQKDGPAEYHKGWRVVGYAPGRIAEAESQRRKDIEEWAALDGQTRSRKLAEGQRAPMPWDEEIWRQRNKPTTVSSRPFGTVSAAEQLREMAQRHGWQYVEVIELAKRKA